MLNSFVKLVISTESGGLVNSFTLCRDLNRKADFGTLYDQMFTLKNIATLTDTHFIVEMYGEVTDFGNLLNISDYISMQLNAETKLPNFMLDLYTEDINRMNEWCRRKTDELSV